ncbi:MAG TPA: M4 family metallopeptidase [Kutzneria sp.]
MRKSAVPPLMIESATARRMVGDWAGACAAARVDVDLNPRDLGRPLADQVRADSDVFGKFIALKSNDPNAAGANRWLLGAGSSLGQVRDMKTPANSGEGPGPDRVNGRYWVGPDGEEHTDAGVVGKVDYLITDGDTFNGQTIRGIGEDKAIALWWKVENLLRSTATFKDLGNALNTACTTNARNRVAGTTTSDCTQVAKAVKATQLNQNA